jgi:hypothetical protein
MLTHIGSQAELVASQGYKWINWYVPRPGSEEKLEQKRRHSILLYVYGNKLSNDKFALGVVEVVGGYFEVQLREASEQ